MKYPNNDCGECSFWLAYKEPEISFKENQEILEHCRECKIDKFLDELGELTKKYEIEIGGCGCCGSPFLIDMESHKFVGDELSYDEEKEKYDTN